ncbi:MAG TPA: hypothetical protein VK050_06485 [Flavobacteriaceae bacterium]|nr:hypothetical protein [Flavobacteriaceae bacterium]
MSLLDKRSDNSDFLKLAFTKKILKEEAKNIESKQTQVMAKNRFESAGWYAFREYSANDTTLRYTHTPEHRFIDMKSRKTKKDGKKKKKHYPIHNRILFGHMNNIIRRLQFEYTDGIKKQLRNEYKI